MRFQVRYRDLGTHQVHTQGFRTVSSAALDEFRRRHQRRCHVLDWTRGSLYDGRPDETLEKTQQAVDILAEALIEVRSALVTAADQSAVERIDEALRKANIV